MSERAGATGDLASIAAASVSFLSASVSFLSFESRRAVVNGKLWSPPPPRDGFPRAASNTLVNVLILVTSDPLRPCVRQEAACMVGSGAQQCASRGQGARPCARLHARARVPTHVRVPTGDRGPSLEGGGEGGSEGGGEV